MKQEALNLLEEEKYRIKEEIDTLKDKIASLTEEMSAIDVVLHRHSSTKKVKNVDVTQKIGSNIATLDDLTNSEKRVYKALVAIGGTGTVNDIFDHMAKDYPDEKESRLRSSARQYASILNKKHVLGADSQGGNKPNIYKIIKKLEDTDK